MATLGKDRVITTRAIRGFLTASFLTKRRTSVFGKFCETRDSYVLGVPDVAGMLGTVPQVEETVNDVPVPVSSFTEYSVQWYNKVFKALIEVQETLLLGDQTGQTRTLLFSLGGRLANFLDLLFFTRLQNATDSTLMPCYDGAALVSATHALGGTAGTQSNIVTGSTTTAYVNANNRDTVAQKIQNDFSNAKAKMSGFIDDHGQPFHESVLEPKSLAIICSPLMEMPMRYAFDAKFIAQTDNVMQNAVGEIIVSNYLPVTGAGASTWYVVRTDNVNKPFVYSRFRQKRDSEMQDALGLENFSGAGPEFSNVTMEDLRNLSTMEIRTNLGRRGTNAEADTIKNDRFLIGAVLRGEILPGIWQNIVQVSNTAS